MRYLELYTPLLISGFAAYLVLFLWKRAALQWGTWFPLLKKLAAGTLLGGSLALLVYVVSHLAQADTQLGLGALALSVGFVLGHLTSRNRRPGQDESLKRGSRLAEANEVAGLMRQQKVPTYLRIGEVPLPEAAEPYHALIVGSTGTGKSVAIRELLSAIRKRGDTVILVDSGGDFLSTMYDPSTDFVFNPYDARSVGWSPTLEISGVWDIPALARSIIPDGTGESKEWNGYAQTFISSVLQRLWEKQDLSLSRFLYFVQTAKRQELEQLLLGTAAYSQLAAERTFGSIRTIANNYLSSYSLLPSGKAEFSVSKMIEAEHSGVLYLTYGDNQLDSLRHLIACVLDVAARSILSLKPDPNRRIWLIVDEFASLGKIQSIEAVATKARKAGGCLVLGLQSVSQLKDRYGDHGAQTILSCLSTWLVLRCSDADTAEYMSRYMGEAEVHRGRSSTSQSESGVTDTWNEESVTQRVLLPSQLQGLKNLTGFLKIAGGYPVCQVALKPGKQNSAVSDAFVARDFKESPLRSLDAPASGLPYSVEPAPTAGAAAPSAATVAQPVYVDKTPRPPSAGKAPVSTNLLVELSRGLKPLSQRLEEHRAAAKKLASIMPAKPHTPLPSGAPSVSPGASLPQTPRPPSLRQQMASGLAKVPPGSTPVVPVKGPASTPVARQASTPPQPSTVPEPTNGPSQKEVVAGQNPRKDERKKANQAALSGLLR